MFLVLLFLVFDSRDDDDDSSRRKGAGNQRKISKKLLDLSVLSIAQDYPLDNLLQTKTDDPREKRGNDERHQILDQILPSRPKIDKHGEHRSGMKHDQKK